MKREKVRMNSSTKCNSFFFQLKPSFLCFLHLLLLLLTIPALKLCNLTNTLCHLTPCSNVINLACLVYFGHHNMHQSSTLRHIGYPLHLRVNSFLHFPWKQTYNSVAIQFPFRTNSCDTTNLLLFGIGNNKLISSTKCWKPYLQVTKDA